ncbi:MAG: hypothetical protein M5R36_27200 [Deltaproteobacteria bacterium]|nr:hypothetical protein [Deltaproteobacteria bacterium]
MIVLGGTRLKFLDPKAKEPTAEDQLRAQRAVDPVPPLTRDPTPVGTPLPAAPTPAGKWLAWIVALGAPCRRDLSCALFRGVAGAGAAGETSVNLDFPAFLG